MGDMVGDAGRRLVAEGFQSGGARLRPALIAMDVDGTIVGADHTLTPFTIATIRRLGQCGVAGVIVTGRAERVALALARELGVTAPLVSCNGALVTDPVTGDRLRVRQMDIDLASHAVEVAHRLGCSPTIWTPDAWYADQSSASSELLTHLLAEPPLCRPLLEVIAAEPVVKVMIGGDPDLLDRVGAELEAEVPGLTRSMPQFCEVGSPDATKLDGIVFVLATLGVDAGSVWGFGDSDNDVGWLGLVGRAIVPANGRPQVLAVADEVIGHHTEDSVAAYLAEHVLA